MLYRVVVYGVFFYCLLFAELKLEDFRGMYHDEVGVITGRLELFVSICAFGKYNRIEFYDSCRYFWKLFRL